MNTGEDVSVVRGARVRYSCRDVAEIDAHLVGIALWKVTNLPPLTGSQRRTVEGNCARDIDKLLHARVMLASLATLDDDLDDLAVGIVRGPDMIREVTT